MAVTACKKESETTDTTTVNADTVSTKAPELTAVSECYEFVQQKDTISLSYFQEGANVTGKLRFKNYEKDSSSGPVEGEFAGDTLKLVYTFDSEGMRSVREIFFLKRAKTLIMGTGDMEEQDAMQVYKDRRNVKYDQSIVLVNTDCD